jgi:hypothetical protein
MSKLNEDYMKKQGLTVNFITLFLAASLVCSAMGWKGGGICPTT